MKAAHSYWWPAPAKLNLMLHITARRDDGYHELETLFQLLDFGDELNFEITECSDIGLLTPLSGVPPEQDLTVKAAKLLQQRAGIGQGVRMRLRKNLPMGGGLGGGSSDAATVLVVLNQLWGAGLSEDQLAELALLLGADVPVFVRGHSAFASGVGERLEPVCLPNAFFTVVTPSVAVATAAVFSDEALQRDCQPLSAQARAEMLAQFPQQLPGKNVCESLVVSQQKEVANVLLGMAEFAPARMTGTGSSVFGLFQSESDARQCAEWFSQQQANVFVAKGVNRSPLLTSVENYTNLS